MSLGGVSGRQVDVVFMPPDGYVGCDGDEHCLFLLRFVPQPAQFDRIAMDDLEKDRYIALDAHGAVMLVNIWTPDSNPATGGSEATFEEGLQAAQAILDSIAVEAAGG